MDDDIRSYEPGKAVPCDDERVVFPDKLVIGMLDSNSMDVYAIIKLLHGEEKAEELKRADERQTSRPTENQQEFWITNHISLIKTNRPDTETFEPEGATRIQDLAEKVGCMVKIVDTVSFRQEPCYVLEEINKIKEITGRFPVCAIINNVDTEFLNGVKDALKKIGVTDYYVVPYSLKENTLPWLHLLRKCLQEGDRVLAANDQQM